jgi:uncharacterized membrane protein YgcG
LKIHVLTLYRDVNKNWEEIWVGGSEAEEDWEGKRGKQRTQRKRRRQRGIGKVRGGSGGGRGSGGRLGSGGGLGR